MAYMAREVYGSPQLPAAARAVEPAPISQSSTDDLGNGARALLNPNNPLFWFGLLLAGTLGLVGVSGAARLGPARVAAGVGRT